MFDNAVISKAHQTPVSPSFPISQSAFHIIQLVTLTDLGINKETLQIRKSHSSNSYYVPGLNDDEEIRGGIARTNEEGAEEHA